MRKIGAWGLLLMNLLFFACDDGRIYEEVVVTPEEGRVVKLTGRLTGAENWASGYTVVVAGFDEEKEYAIITKAIPTTECKEVILAGISDEVKRIELCVVNRLRKRILTYETFDCPVTADTIRLDAGTKDLGMYATLQSQLFNTTCANCHGASTQAAAGLFLTEGKSYEALVNQPSLKVADKLLVKPGDADESVLYQTLATRISAAWNYDHTKEVLSDEWIDVLEDWIDEGANK
ncbi:MAG: hypothetical protein IJX29_00125 [Bacteroides sp.]|nr:hypothetical protein [Bacteroides sp.]